MVCEEERCIAAECVDRVMMSFFLRAFKSCVNKLKNMDSEKSGEKFVLCKIVTLMRVE